MRLPRTAITAEPISAERLAADLEADVRTLGEGCGALCTFVGVVRATHAGRAVRYLEYEAHEPLAARALARIAAEVEAEWPAGRVAIHHRIGRLEIGEASVVIVAAAAHRAEAFGVCRYAIERVKQIVPVWKHEFFTDGDDWVDGSVADPDDPAARARARSLACA
ncbi:MAG TPA: molybdenum cofactor biosynthesis protein MoaE [Vicinamibacterales bacterium]|nr:molybdenum cofactor biosynthesis protein MoaE [Vicinamibacterales bacterium]